MQENGCFQKLWLLWNIGIQLEYRNFTLRFPGRGEKQTLKSRYKWKFHASPFPMQFPLHFLYPNPPK